MTDIKQEPQATEPTGGNQEPKTFTQDEVNAFVEKRLWSERKKYEDYEALKEKAGRMDSEKKKPKRSGKSVIVLRRR